MNLSGKIAISLAGGLTLSASIRADDVALSADPYAVVVVRNIFGLNPPPPPNPNPQDTTPPPKITPNGIMTIFGEVQALFKVAGVPKPGSPPPPDQTYCLSEGQRQDDIEVVKIDEKNSIVTFNNHGETQTLPLVYTAPSSTAAAAGAPAPPGPGQNRPMGHFGPGTVNPGGGPGAKLRGGGVGYGGATANPSGASASYGGTGNFGNPNPSGLLGNAPVRNDTVTATSQIPEGMTPEQQVINMELNREVSKQQSDPIAGLIPPTDLTPPETTGPTGNPLITPGSPGAPQ